MKNIVFLSGLLMLFISFSSCGKKKEKTDPPETASNSELLTAHDWKGVEVIRFVNGNETTHTSITNCKFVFNTDNHYKKYDNGTVKQDGTWELFDHTSIIMLRLRYYSSSVNHNVLDDLTISELSGSKLEFSMPVIDGSNDILRDDYFYQK